MAATISNCGQQIISNLQLENHFHTRFADVRCSSDSFLYVADNIDHYADLENYCDDMHEPKIPLLLLGEKGVGKSALLANWTIRRKRNKRKNAYLTSTSSHEFIFWHAVGCTRSSANVNVMLRRLMTELKKRFDLTREVPTKNERLSWDLPRFLDQASKKGSVIIVLDGIHQLYSDDGSEVGLTWLPLEIPANVRIIVSVSSHIPLNENSIDNNDILTEDMIVPKHTRFVNELNRRVWHLVKLRPQEFSLAKNIIMQYFHKSLQIDAGNHNKFDAFLTSLPADINETIAGVDGLVFFPNQIDDLVKHKCAPSPQYLRLFLESSNWTAERGYSLWTVVDQFLATDNYEQLLRNILHLFEDGFVANDVLVKSARDRSYQAGGVSALRQLFPWHPNFQIDNKDNIVNRINPFDNKDGDLPNKSSNVISLGSAPSVLDSLENPVWISAFGDVQSKLSTSFGMYQNTIEKSGRNIANVSFIESFKPKVRKNRRQSFSDRVSEAFEGKDLAGYARERALKDDCFGLQCISHLIEGTQKKAAEASPRSTLRMRGLAKSPSHASLNHRYSSYSMRIELSEVDDSLKNVPVYLLGGHSYEGLGNLLGNALALLHTSYCGLTESELWNMLMQLKNKEMAREPEDQLSPLEAMLVMMCYQNRGAYEDIWRTMDLHKKCIITKQQFLLGIRKVDSTVKEEDIDILLHLTKLEGQKVNYKEFSEKIVALDKQQRVTENSNRMAPLQNDDADMNSMRFDDNQSYASLGPVLESSLLSALRCVGVIRSSEHGVLILPIDNDSLRSVIFNEFVLPRGGVEYWHNTLSSFFLKLPSSLRRSEELPWHLECTRKWYILKDTLADLKTFEIMSTCHLCNELIRYWLLLIHGPLFLKTVSEKDKRLEEDEHEAQVVLLKNIEYATKYGLSESVLKRHQLKDKVAPFDIVEVYNKSIEGWVAENCPNSRDIYDKLSLVGAFLLRFCQSLPDMEKFPPYMRLPLSSKMLGSFPLGFQNLIFQHFDGDASVDIDREGVKLHLSHYYYMRRWMWIQLPWLALKFKFDLCAFMDEKRKSAEEATAGIAAILAAESKLPTAGVGGEGEFKMGGFIEHSTVSAKSSKSEHMRGFWELKRKDPSMTFDDAQKTKKRNTHVLNRLSTSLGVEEFCVKQFSEDRILHPVRRLKPLHKYRRSMRESVESSRSLQFSSPTLRSLRHNTVFPSVARDLLNRHINVVKAEGDPFVLAAACARAGDSNIPADLDLFNEIQDIYTADANKYAEHPVKETTAEEETGKNSKLRAIVDKASFILGERRALLETLKGEYLNRNGIDDETVSKLNSGEEAICSLERKHEVVSSAIAEAERMNRGYQALVLVCESNPCQTKHHLAMVEQEVKLAKQQLLDLVKFRHNIYAEATKSDDEGSKFIMDQARYYETMRAGTRVKRDKQMQIKRDLQLSLLRIGAQKEDIQGYYDFSDDEYADEVAGLRDAWKDMTIQEYSIEHLGKAKLLFDRAQSRRQFVGIGYDAEAAADGDGIESEDDLLRAPDDVDTNDPPVHWNAEAIVQEYNRVLEETKSTSVEAFCSRYTEAQALHVSLAAQGTMAESKVVLLRSELVKLSNFYVDITLSSTDSDMQKSSAEIQEDMAAAVGKQDSRALDERLILRQLHLNQIARQMEKNEVLLNEIRVSLTNLIALLEANSKLMSALPQKPAPPLITNSDIAEALAWCEDKVIAVTEVLLYDTSKLAGKSANSKWQKLDVTDDNQPLPERQVELAGLMEHMLRKDPAIDDGFRDGRHWKPNQRKLKKKLGLSRAAILARDDTTVELRSPRAVMVPPKSAIDTDFDSKMQAAIARQDDLALQASMDESFFPDSIKRREALEMSEFVSSALSSHDAAFLLRRQKHIRSVVTGKFEDAKQSKGWAVDSLLKKKNLESFVREFDPPAHLISKKKVGNDAVKPTHVLPLVKEEEIVPSRRELKSKTAEVMRHHRLKQEATKEHLQTP